MNPLNPLNPLNPMNPMNPMNLELRLARTRLPAPSRCRRPDLSRFPGALAWRDDLQHRHVDAEGCAELARPHARRKLVRVLSRPGLLPRRTAHPALHAERRRRRSPRSTTTAPDLAVRSDEHRLRARCARLLRCHSHLARPGANDIEVD